MKDQMNLIGYAEIFGMLVNVYGESYGDATASNVTLEVKNKIGQFVELDSRYFLNCEAFHRA